MISQYITVYSAMTNKPTGYVSAAQNRLVMRLVDAGIWSRLDAFIYSGKFNKRRRGGINKLDRSGNI